MAELAGWFTLFTFNKLKWQASFEVFGEMTKRFDSRINLIPYSCSTTLAYLVSHDRGEGTKALPPQAPKSG